MQQNRNFDIKEYNSYPGILGKQVKAMSGEQMVFTEFLSPYARDR